MQFGSVEQAVRVAAGPVILDGDLSLPDGARGIVLFAHGSGSSRLSPRNRHVARLLNQAKLATLFGQERQLGSGLDALGQRHDLQAPDQLQHPADDRSGVPVVRQIAHERPVDLHHIHGEFDRPARMMPCMIEKDALSM